MHVNALDVFPTIMRNSITKTRYMYITTRTTEKLNVRKSYSGKLSFYSNLVNSGKQMKTN